MPRPKKTPEAEVSVDAEPKRKRTATAKSAAASHKHTTKKAAPPVESESAAQPAEVVAVSSTPAVTHEAIAKLAYSYWEARGYQGGSPEADWLRAERDLLILAQNR